MRFLLRTDRTTIRARSSPVEGIVVSRYESAFQRLQKVGSTKRDGGTRVGTCEYVLCLHLLRPDIAVRKTQCINGKGCILNTVDHNFNAAASVSQRWLHRHGLVEFSGSVGSRCDSRCFGRPRQVESEGTDGRLRYHTALETRTEENYCTCVVACLRAFEGKTLNPPP